MVELKPCPFCGGTNVAVEYNEYEDKTVWCDDCSASGPIVSLGLLKINDDALREAAHAKAIELWNKRV